MKKVLILCLIIGLTFAVTGATCKDSWLNVLNSDLVTYTCAGESGKITAAQMLEALTLGMSIYKGDPIDFQKAISVLQTIKSTGCFVVAQLKEAFAVVDAVNTQVALKQMKALKTAPTPLPEYAPLRVYVQ